MERYWRPRLARAGAGPFEIDALFPEADGVVLDYRGYDGVPARTHFSASQAGGKSASPPAHLSERPPEVVRPPRHQ